MVDFIKFLREANEAFNYVLQTRHDVYSEKDRSNYVLGYLCQQYDCTDVFNEYLN